MPLWDIKVGAEVEEGSCVLILEDLIAATGNIVAVNSV